MWIHRMRFGQIIQLPNFVSQQLGYLHPHLCSLIQIFRIRLFYFYFYSFFFFFSLRLFFSHRIWSITEWLKALSVLSCFTSSFVLFLLLLFTLFYSFTSSPVSHLPSVFSFLSEVGAFEITDKSWRKREKKRMEEEKKRIKNERKKTKRLSR